MLIFRTGFKHIPCINGKEIDLYLLYWLVTAQGGWERVSKVVNFLSQIQGRKDLFEMEQFSHSFFFT